MNFTHMDSLILTRYIEKTFSICHNNIVQSANINGGNEIEIEQKEKYGYADCHFSHHHPLFHCLLWLFDFAAGWSLEICFGHLPSCFCSSYDQSLHRKNTRNQER